MTINKLVSSFSPKTKLRGFTLLELVIVIAIIGILAVIVLPNMIQALAKARDAKKMTELRGIQTFLTTEGIDTGLRYPNNQTDLRAWFSGTGNRIPSSLTATIATSPYKYIGVNCDSTAVTVGGTVYSGTCATYQLWVELEQHSPALENDIDTGTSLGTAYTGSTLQDGTTETCVSTSATDCVFDLAP